ncbi:MAG: hypothetical protein Ct9H90mP6_00950 [Gammaproteobacteria bacterium]|nr:MAG: hypothetical protein Ct9H90mP6_00950 [Gammaproteobacteria bacterium]
MWARKNSYDSELINEKLGFELTFPGLKGFFNSRCIQMWMVS